MLQLHHVREASPWTLTRSQYEPCPGPSGGDRGGIALADLEIGCHDDEMVDASDVSPADLAGLIEIMDDAAAAYIRGDLRHYLSLFDHPEDYTLMPPYGGDTQRGYTPTDEQVEETSRFFASGEARLDVAESYVSGNLAVLVAVERQHGVVGGSDDQDWSLRVTLVFRRRGGRWQLVHRHADPLVREIPWGLFARIARGDVQA